MISMAAVEVQRGHEVLKSVVLIHMSVLHGSRFLSLLTRRRHVVLYVSDKTEQHRLYARRGEVVVVHTLRRAAMHERGGV